MTWLHRALVLIDLFLLWVFWPAVVAGGKQIWSLRGPRWFLATLSYGAVMMSVVWATFPGEWLDEQLAEGVRHFGGFAKHIAKGLAMRHDDGSQSMSDHFQKELADRDRGRRGS